MMDRLVIDETLPEKLLSLRSSVELVDRAGHLVAVVHPRTDPALYEIVGEELGEEEIERRFKSDRRIPADEIMVRLRKLA